MSDAKRLLAETIRGTAQDPAKGLRHRLIEAIRSEAAGRYRLAVSLKEAGLDEAHRRRRERLEAYLDEKTRATKPKNASEEARTRERLLREAEKEVAATLLNRLITLRLLEARGLSKPPIVTAGWNSQGYRQFRDFAPGLTDDETEGYGFLLQLVFDDLATDLPGLFGDVGLTRLFPIPAKALQEAIEALDNPELASAWTDDVTLGWVYQYWNDPERRAIDALLDKQDRLRSEDIAAKTQVFTERYMVEWLLQNSLGVTWLCMCKKQGWTADAERVLPVLDERRTAWRKRREAGEIALDALMPISGELEDHWKYYVPQPLPDDAVASAPESVKALKILDPACGSGHFLVIAFDLLASLYREEARHRGQSITDRKIAESILENNLHGIDIDPRAVQIATASLFVKARTLSKDAQPRNVNLVAPTFQLGNLPEDDPAVVRLRQDLEREVGIPEALTTKILSSLAGVDYLGALLKVDVAVEHALRNAELEVERTYGQGDLFSGFAAERVNRVDAQATVLDRLERFLRSHSSSGDLGLRLDGEQLARGLCFLSMSQSCDYSLVIGNPPYLGTQALADTEYLDAAYPESRENLCTAMLERSTELVRRQGLVAFVTVRNWLYVSQLSTFRKALLESTPICCGADLGLGGFESLPGVEAMAVVLRKGRAPECLVADVRNGEAGEKAAGLLSPQVFRTDPTLLAKLPGSPFVYRWSAQSIGGYLARPLLGEVAPVRVGMKTSDNLRFLRCPWELPPRASHSAVNADPEYGWMPYIKGAAGKAWIEPLSHLINWRNNGLEVRIALDVAYGQTPQAERHFFEPGVAFSTIGRSFLARMHLYPSIFDVAGSSVFPPDVPACLCLLNSRAAREIVEDLNPTINFQVGDVARIPYRDDAEASAIVNVVKEAFSAHESAEETSLAFRKPQPSPWRYVQDWAERAVNRAEGAPLPSYEPVSDPLEPEAFVSFAVGVALGRFDPEGHGLLDAATPAALPAGILFVSPGGRDSLDSASSVPLHNAWKEHAEGIGKSPDLREYLRSGFFTFHKKLYENRPIYFPLTSKGKNFVAFVSIHRWADDTLSVLLADHLMPAKRRLEGELGDLRIARVSEQSRSSRARDEGRLTEIQKLLEDLSDFISKVTEVADRGPPCSDDKTTKREVDARFVMDLDDGVMVNSAALWSLLDPVWKDPKKWWKQLAERNGPKGTHFDWSRTAARYFPARVAAECRQNPVVAAAHRCLWREHPRIAMRWELALRSDKCPEFRIPEPDADACRAEFLARDPAAITALSAAGAKGRRAGRRKTGGTNG